MRHIISLLTTLIVIINLGFWVIWLALLGLLKLIFQQNPLRSWINMASELCYRGAVAVHNFWMFRIVGLRLNIQGQLPDHSSPIIISNHQTWTDIPVLHGAVTADGGPILKFLIKRELLWVPIIGWICYSLNFPRLFRGQGNDARRRDYSAIKSFSESLHSERGALMIFSEGTRFTSEKYRNQSPPYKHLLTPRPGGLKIALETAPKGTPVVDITIIYRGSTNFWHCIGGGTQDVDVIIRTFDSTNIGQIRTWLDQRWAEKDAYFPI